MVDDNCNNKLSAEELTSQIERLAGHRKVPSLTDCVSKPSRFLSARTAKSIRLVFDEFGYFDDQPGEYPDFVTPLQRIARSNNVADSFSRLERKLADFPEEVVDTLFLHLILNALYETIDADSQIRLPSDQARELLARVEVIRQCAERIIDDLDVQRKRWRSFGLVGVLNELSGEPVKVNGRVMLKGRLQDMPVTVSLGIDEISDIMKSIIAPMEAKAAILNKRGREGMGLRERRHFTETLEGVLLEHINEADLIKMGHACNPLLASLYNAAFNCSGSSEITPREMGKLRSKVRDERKRPSMAPKSE